jgi:ABC-type transport system involved in cytochrome bd biosynthesis fused ATPase/permease subunit
MSAPDPVLKLFAREVELKAEMAHLLRAYPRRLVRVFPEDPVVLNLSPRENLLLVARHSRVPGGVPHHQLKELQQWLKTASVDLDLPCHELPPEHAFRVRLARAVAAPRGLVILVRPRAQVSSEALPAESLRKLLVESVSFCARLFIFDLTSARPFYPEHWQFAAPIPN